MVCIETNTATYTLVRVQVEERGCGDSGKMQTALQDLLQANDIPEKQLTPVYNPRWVDLLANRNINNQLAMKQVVAWKIKSGEV